MINTLEQTLNTLKKINAGPFVHDKIPEKTFQEQAIKLEALEKNIKNYLELLGSFKQEKAESQQLDKLLVEMHAGLMNFLDAIDAIDDLLAEVTQKKLHLNNKRENISSPVEHLGKTNIKPKMRKCSGKKKE